MQDAGYRDVGRSSPPAVRATGKKATKPISFGITAQPKTYSPPPAQPRFGGGGQSYGGGGGHSFVGSNSGGSISRNVAPPTPPPPPPQPPSLEAFAAKDSTYQGQISSLKKALADYMAQQGQSKTQYLTNYAGDLDTLKGSRTQGLADLENDYASRGLLQSGLYADSMSDLNTDYDKRQAQLDQAKAAYLAGLTGDLTNFQSEQQITQQKALQEAAARRATKYGL